MRLVNFTADNNLTLLQCGAEYFPALVKALDDAKLEIYLETYIFAADEIGDLIKVALKRAAARGVIVNVIVDWLGTGDAYTKVLAKEFSDAHIQYRIFNPWFKRGVTRSHRKMCVVDRKIAFVGGLNVNHDLRADHDFHMILPFPRWDFAVQITGPLVARIHLESEAQWLRIGRLKLRLRLELFREVRQVPVTGNGAPAH
ncbi:MAG: phospholipase D-like domain-containing protein, partial [Burkholderiaceae bacterium]